MQEVKKPLISVLMGIRYQRDEIDLLKRAVESILNQTFSDFEFLVCEDGSTHEARQYLQALAQKEPRLRLIPGVGADTLAAKLNRCIGVARGEFLARMDDDDMSDSSRFQLQLDYLEAHPEISFVGSVAHLEQDGEIIGKRALPERPQVKDFLFVQPFLHPTLMFRACVFRSSTFYCEDARCAGCEDYDLLLRLYEKDLAGANLQEFCFTYTLPPRGTSNRTWKMRYNEVCTRWVRFKSLGFLPKALPYVVKPVIVGLIPSTLLDSIKRHRN